MTTRFLARAIVATSLTIAVLASCATAQGSTPASKAAQGSGGAVSTTAAASVDSALIVRVLAHFRAAMAAGDSAEVLSLLAPDVVVLESGGAENFAEFRAHHLAADIEFARAVEETRMPLRVVVRGDMAWVAGTSTAKGQFRGRAVDSAGTELMVFTRTPDGWRIAAIHWSSRRRT